MTKYEMPALTDSQRSKQIEFCEAIIKSLWADKMLVETCLIALAALTAEPVSLDNWQFSGLTYQSPPVPALNLPDEVTVSDAPSFMNEDEKTCWVLGYFHYESEVKRLNGVIENDGREG